MTLFDGDFGFFDAIARESDLNLDMNDEVMYTGEYTGQYSESVSSLTGAVSRDPLFKTTDIEVLRKWPY